MRKRDIHEIPIDPPEPRVEKEPETQEGLPSSDPSDLDQPPAQLPYQTVVDHLQRLQAEFTNYKRRVDRERLESTIWGQRVLIEKLLPALDDLERALSSAGKDSGALTQGFSLVRDKILSILTEAGLERITTQDLPFDPERHEALATVPAEPDRAGKVIEELVPGYTFRGKLVRPARVTVGIEAGEGDETRGSH